MKKQIISPAEAAKIIGCHPATVRARMLYGEWPIGNVIKPSKANGRKVCRYEIAVPKLMEMLGTIQKGLEDERDEL